MIGTGGTGAGRALADRCPGVLRPHQAADGALIRLRLPGGRTTGPTLRGLAGLAKEFGSGDLQLTSRAGLQVRGLPAVLPEAFLAGVSKLGLLPSPAHERVRNVAASPLTGLAGGAADVSGLVAELDRRILAEPALAGLPGRFLFVVDDGRGDVARLSFDLGYRAVSADEGLVIVGDHRWGRPVAARDAAQILVGLAREFLTVRGDAWHVRERPDWVSRQQAGMVSAPSLGELRAPLGAIGGAASVQVPLALLTPAQVDAVARAAGDGPVVITPWRGLVVPGAAAALDDLVATGLLADEDAAWSLVSACVGAPACSAALVDPRAAAAGLVAGGGVRARVHLSGCARRCGAPSEPHLDLVADPRTRELVPS